METYTGKEVNPLHIRPQDVCLPDIARSHSMQCRFGGHVERFFSNANHCVNMAQYFFDLGEYLNAKYALLHEGDEEFFGDIITPIKYLDIMTDVRVAIKKAQRAVYRSFGLKGKTPKVVKELDDKMKILEARKVKPNSKLAQMEVDGAGIKVKVMSQRQSEKAFIEMYYKIENALKHQVAP